MVNRSEEHESTSLFQLLHVCEEDEMGFALASLCRKWPLDLERCASRYDALTYKSTNRAESRARFPGLP